MKYSQLTELYDILIESSQLKYLIDEENFELQFSHISEKIGALYEAEYVNIGLIENDNQLKEYGVWSKVKINNEIKNKLLEYRTRITENSLVGISLSNAKNANQNYYTWKNIFNDDTNSSLVLPSQFDNIDKHILDQHIKLIFESKKLINFRVDCITSLDGLLLGYLLIVNSNIDHKIDFDFTINKEPLLIGICQKLSFIIENIFFHRKALKDEIKINDFYKIDDIDILLSSVLKYFIQEFNSVTAAFIMATNNGFIDSQPFLFTRAVEFVSSEIKSKYKDKINLYSIFKNDSGFLTEFIHGKLDEEKWGKIDETKFLSKELLEWSIISEAKAGIVIPIIKSKIGESHFKKHSEKFWGLIYLQTHNSDFDEIYIGRIKALSLHIQALLEKTVFAIRYDQIKKLNKKLEELPHNINNKEIYNVMVDLISETIGAEYCSFFAVDDNNKYLYLKASNCTECLLGKNQTKISVDSLTKQKIKIYDLDDNSKSGITGKTFIKNLNAIIFELNSNNDFYESLTELSSSNLNGNVGHHKTMLTVPIKGEKGKVIGVIRCINKIRRKNIFNIFTMGDIELINIISSVFINAILINEIHEKRYISMTHFSHESRIPMQALSDDLITLEYQIKQRFIANNIPDNIQKTLQNIHLRASILKNNIITAEYLYLTDLSKKPKLFKLISMYDLISNVRKTFYNLDIQLMTKNAPNLLVDKEQITRVFYNLILNAERYSMLNKTIKVIYNISSYLPYLGWHQFSIQNYGIGIEEEEKDLIFDSYYRSDKAKKHYQTGTGIGLKICREIMKNHDGEILVTKLTDPTELSIFFPNK